MKNHLNRIAKDLTEKSLEKFWPGFELVAFALYNKNDVYLFNHPKFKNGKEGNFEILRWNEQFNGCTLILYMEYPTAIVNVELYEDYESIFSILAHELFHGFQYIKGEKRFPDELMGMTYPLSLENVEIRNRERQNLFHAVTSKKVEEKNKYIKSFIALRETRAKRINKYTIYENLIETIEGPAWYVECKAYYQMGSAPYNSVLEKYQKILLDHYESSLHIRRSCYGSGLFICMLLDEISTDWKENYFQSGASLFEIFKQQFGHFQTPELTDIKISKETKDIFHFVEERKTEAFKKFEIQEGTHLFIEGDIRIKFFDPMNILSIEDKRLYKNFLKFSFNNHDYFVQQPVVVYFRNDFQSISKMHLVLKDKPIEKSNSLLIDGIGEIQGKYQKQGEIFHLIGN